MEYDFNSTKIFLDLCQDSIIIVDTNLIIVFINEYSLRLFKYDLIDIIGKNISILIEPLLNNLILGKKKDNTTFKAEVTLKYYNDHDINLIGYMIEDITQKNKDLLEHTKLDFLSSVSHEFRTPLNGILGLSDILMDIYTLPTEQKEHIKSIKECANSLKTFINDIRDYSLLTAKKLTLQKESININLLIFEIHKLIVVMNLENSNITVTETFTNNSNITYIITDYQRLKQVILNLISNAFKFTDIGNITINYIIIDDKFKFTIKDTGIGIKSDNKNILFKMFSRIDNSEKKIYQGTGLGLAISKNIVELLKGTIDYTSEYEKGSIFFFEIPLSNTTDNNCDKTINKKLCGKILLVEDNKINVLLAKRAITSLGLEVDVAYNGLEAIDLVITKNNIYVLIFMDVNMPLLNGIDTTIKLRNENIEWPIIGLSGSINDDEIDNCINVGMNDYLSKPFNIASLEKMLRKWL